MRRLLNWLLGRHALGYVAHWTPEREQYYTQATYRYLGIRPEPIYPWSRTFRPTKRKARKQAASKVLRPQFKQRSA